MIYGDCLDFGSEYCYSSIRMGVNNSEIRVVPIWQIVI